MGVLDDIADLAARRGPQARDAIYSDRRRRPTYASRSFWQEVYPDERAARRVLSDSDFAYFLQGGELDKAEQRLIDLERQAQDAYDRVQAGRGENVSVMRESPTDQIERDNAAYALEGARRARELFRRDLGGNRLSQQAAEKARRPLGRRHGGQGGAATMGGLFATGAAAGGALALPSAIEQVELAQQYPELQMPGGARRMEPGTRGLRGALFDATQEIAERVGLNPYTAADLAEGLSGAQGGIGVSDFAPLAGTQMALADFQEDPGILSAAGVAGSVLPGGVAAAKLAAAPAMARRMALTGKAEKAMDSPRAASQRREQAMGVLANPIEYQEPPSRSWIFDRAPIRDAMEGHPGVPQVELPRQSPGPRQSLGAAMRPFASAPNLDLVRAQIERANVIMKGQDPTFRNAEQQLQNALLGIEPLVPIYSRKAFRTGDPDRFR